MKGSRQQISGRLEKRKFQRYLILKNLKNGCGEMEYRIIVLVATPWCALSKII